MSSATYPPGRQLLPWKIAEDVCRSPDERVFLDAVREAHRRGAGFGWMQQVIEIEWNNTADGSWGPYHFETRLAELEAEIARLKSNSNKSSQEGS